MIVSNQGAIIYEIGDVVILPSKRPRNWASNGEMDCYLGNIVTLTQVHYGSGYGDFTEAPKGIDGQFRFAGANGWTFHTSEIVSLATPQAIEEARMIKQRKLAEFKEKFKQFVLNGDDIFAIAKDIFGEEYVDLHKIDETEFDILVLFPEVNITNSRRHKHTIKDLYVKINIQLTLDGNMGDRLSNISLDGRRGKLSDEEYQSNYGHSHFSGGGIDRWSDFCLGSSDFAMILQTMRYSLTQEDWTLLFLSLGNYVSWESIEGGPYRNMQNISSREQSVSPSSFTQHALEIIKTLPNSCFTFNSKVIELNQDHPDLLHHYATHSRIKSFRSTASSSNFTALQTRFNSYVRENYRSFTFKGETVIPTVYSKKGETAETTSTEENLDQQVIDFYNSTINKELKKYNIQYEYKKLYNAQRSQTIFGEAVTFQ